MVESYQATIEWSGSADLGAVLLVAASRPGCSATLDESDGNVRLKVVVEDVSIQSLRDKIDELLVVLSDIEENHVK